MGRPSTYSRDTALALLRLLYEGHSLRGAARLLGAAREHSRLSRWKDQHPELRVAVEMVLTAEWANRQRAEDGAPVDLHSQVTEWIERGLYAPPGRDRDEFWRVASETADRVGGPIALDRIVEEYLAAGGGDGEEGEEH